MPFKVGDKLTDEMIDGFNEAHTPKSYPTDEQGEFLPPEGKYTLQIIGGEIDGSPNTGKGYCLLFFRVLDGDWKNLEFNAAMGLTANFKWDELFAATGIAMQGREAFEVIQHDLEGKHVVVQIEHYTKETPGRDGKVWRRTSPNLTFLMETAVLKEKASAVSPAEEDDIPF